MAKMNIEILDSEGKKLWTNMTDSEFEDFLGTVQGEKYGRLLGVLFWARKLAVDGKFDINLFQIAKILDQEDCSKRPIENILKDKTYWLRMNDIESDEELRKILDLRNEATILESYAMLIDYVNSLKESMRVDIGRIKKNVEGFRKVGKTYTKCEMDWKKTEDGFELKYIYKYSLPPNISPEDCFHWYGHVLPFRPLTSEDNPEFLYNKNIFFDRADCHSHCDLEHCNSNIPQYQMPIELQEIREDFVNQLKIQKIKEGKDIWDGPVCKLKSETIESPETEPDKLMMYFCNASYFDFLITNYNLHTPLIKEGDKLLTVWDRYVRHPSNLLDISNSVLVNALGTCLFVINNENKKRPFGIITKRTRRVAGHPGKWQLSCGGNLNPERHLNNDRPDPFITIIKEADRELGLQLTPEELVCLGLGIDLKLGIPVLLFMCFTKFSLDDIRKLSRKEPFEIESIDKLDLSSQKNIHKFILENFDISTEHHVCLALAYERLQRINVQCDS